jgi:ParB-like chromosome segregation protein Spo0J
MERRKFTREFKLETVRLDVYRRRIRAGEAIEPLIVTNNGDLLDGHHRWLAFKAKGVSLVRVQFDDDDESAA